PPGPCRCPGRSSLPLRGLPPSRDQLLRPQREPELDAVVCAAQVPARELLDPLDPVAQRVPVAVAVACGALPVPVAIDVGLERAEEFTGIALIGVLDRAEDALAVEAECLRILDGEQQRESAEIPM